MICCMSSHSATTSIRGPRLNSSKELEAAGGISGIYNVAFCWTSIFQPHHQRFIPICLYLPAPLVADLYIIFARAFISVVFLADS